MVAVFAVVVVVVVVVAVAVAFLFIVVIAFFKLFVALSGPPCHYRNIPEGALQSTGG